MKNKQSSRGENIPSSTYVTDTRHELSSILYLSGMKAQVSTKKSSTYLTKRATINLSRAATVSASKRAMQLVGYIVKIENGWVVRKYRDGSTQKIVKYRTPTRYQLALD